MSCSVAWPNFQSFYCTGVHCGFSSWTAFGLGIFYCDQRTCFQYGGAQQLVGTYKILLYCTSVHSLLLFFLGRLQAEIFYCDQRTCFQYRGANSLQEFVCFYSNSVHCVLSFFFSLQAGDSWLRSAHKLPGWWSRAVCRNLQDFMVPACIIVCFFLGRFQAADFLLRPAHMSPVWWSRAVCRNL